MPLANKDLKREKILSSAATVFAKKGFHETKMQDVADTADVGKGTLYEYFATKEELFLAVYDSWMDEYESSMKQSAESATNPLSRADAIIETAIQFYEKHANHAAILLEFWAHAIRSEDKRALNRIREMKNELAHIGSEVTKSLIKLKTFTEVDTESFARLELGISDGIFLQWILDGKSYSLREAYKFRQSVIGNGLLTSPIRKTLAFKTNPVLKKGFTHSKNSSKHSSNKSK